jgi:hypothetical protein
VNPDLVRELILAVAHFIVLIVGKLRLSLTHRDVMILDKLQQELEAVLPGLAIALAKKKNNNSKKSSLTSNPLPLVPTNQVVAAFSSRFIETCGQLNSSNGAIEAMFLKAAKITFALSPPTGYLFVDPIKLIGRIKTLRKKRDKGSDIWENCMTNDFSHGFFYKPIHPLQWRLPDAELLARL